MVRSRLPLAINFIQKEKLNPDSVFSNIDTNYSKDEIKILRLAAWFHDIGKASATKMNIEKNRLTAYGHEQPKHYMPQIEKLSGNLRSLYDNLSPQEKDILHFVIDNHMSLDQNTGFPKKLWPQIFDDTGKIKNEIKPKLLMTFIAMDRTGRLRGKDFEPHFTTFKHKQDASLKNVHQELSDMNKPLELSKDKHLEKLKNAS